ncbi:restriction endonuclease subunit S [Streptomyces sp. Vc74B-19]|uniref:restriction endonuclease subunit S n=1 Tax=Streptomyces sp. Vc74B-19 TaxID=2741324 RepID=UPI001BFC9244|nr:restriction endonuclease subunit S [Streptomyces sp. Vc74B-19]MBT3165444.1 restriction endonuclease subunit S [Streptomyces sp. Vc74B-19]
MTTAEQWLDSAPAHWTFGRLKNLISGATNGTWGSDPAADGTDVRCVRAADFDRASRRADLSNAPLRYVEPSSLRQHLLQDGDLVLEKSGGGEKQPVGMAVLFTGTDKAVCSNFCARLKPSIDVDPRFLTYVFIAAYGQGLTQAAIKQTTGIQNLDTGAFFASRWAYPPKEEQRRIADFLDAETARIDRLATKRDMQIATLSERELGIIGQALSGGATRVDGQPTGWPWLPYIPANWKIGPVYAYFSTELGKMLNADRATGQGQRPYLRNANVHWYEIDTFDMATMHFEPDEVNRYSVRRGDLLVCEGGAGVAEAAVWDGRIKECYFQKSLHRVRQAGPVPVEWLMYWLRYAKSCGVFRADGNIATIPHLTGEQLRQYRIPVPKDGQTVVANASRAIRDTSIVRDRLSQAQKLLAERRQSLITAAVTGQFDVSAASGHNVTEGVSA